MDLEEIDRRIEESERRIREMLGEFGMTETIEPPSILLDGREYPLVVPIPPPPGFSDAEYSYVAVLTEDPVEQTDQEEREQEMLRQLESVEDVLPPVTVPPPPTVTFPAPVPSTSRASEPYRRDEAVDSRLVRIPEAEETRRIAQIEAWVHGLPMEEMVVNMDGRQLSTKGAWEKVRDRLLRFEIRESVGRDLAVWDERRDERQTALPFSVPVMLSEPSVDEIIDPTQRDSRNLPPTGAPQPSGFLNLQTQPSGFIQPPSFESNRAPTTTGHRQDTLHNTHRQETVHTTHRQLTLFNPHRQETILPTHRQPTSHNTHNQGARHDIHEQQVHETLQQNTRDNTLQRQTELTIEEIEESDPEDRRGNVSETDARNNESWEGEAGESWQLARVNMRAQTERSRGRGLPTGQSGGRYRDPISFHQESLELASQSRRQTIPVETVPRKATVTFAETPSAGTRVRASTPTRARIERRDTSPQAHRSYPITHITHRTQSNPSGYSQTHPSHPVPVDPSGYSQTYPIYPPPPDPSSHTQYQRPATTTQAFSLNPSQMPHSTPNVPPPVRLQDRQEIAYHDESVPRNPNITHTITNPVHRQATPHTQSQPYYGYSECALQYQSRYASTGQADLTAGFVPFGNDTGNRTTSYSERVGKCGAYLRTVKVGFNGVDGDADEFLRRLKEASEMYGLSDEESIGVLPYVLEGHVLGWFRADRGNWQHYRDFVQRFRLRYSSLGLESRLWEEIRERTQGMSEPLATYLTSLQILFSRLDSPVPVTVQLDMAFANLNPKYMAEMNRTDVSSYDDFLMQGHRFEEKLRRMARYAPPKGPEKSLVPAAAYTGKSKRNERVAAVKNTPECHVDAAVVPRTQSNTPKHKKKAQNAGTQTAPPPPEDLPPRTAIKCFNCGKEGHMRRWCPNQNKQENSGNEKRER